MSRQTEFNEMLVKARQELNIVGLDFKEHPSGQFISPVYNSDGRLSNLCIVTITRTHAVRNTDYERTDIYFSHLSPMDCIYKRIIETRLF